jgi:neutral ceramidase
MRRLAIAAVAVAVAASIAPLPNRSTAQAGGLRAGVGIGDITPPVGTPMFAYSSREVLVGGVQPFVDQTSFDTNFYAKTFVASKGVSTRVRARALVLDHDGVKLALVALDLGGMPYELHQAVVARIRDTGITRDRLLLSVTHSHGSVGPIWPATHSGYAILGGDAYDPRVFGHVVDGIVQAIRQADTSLEPARVGTAQVDVYDATNNRAVEAHRLNPDEPHGEREDDKPHSLASTMTVVRADTIAGRPLGLWTAFAIHGTAFGDEMLHFTGDNQAVAERVVESEIRRRAGLTDDDLVVHALANGAEGDLSPRGTPAFLGEVPLAVPPESTEETEAAVWVSGDFADAEMAGRRVGRAALLAWEIAGRDMRDDVALDARFTLYSMVAPSVNGEPVGLTTVLGCGGVMCDDGVALPVDVPGQGRKVPLAVGPPGVLAPVFAPLQAMRIGDLAIAALPFETTKQMGARITAAVGEAAAPLGVTSVALAGLANGYLSYMATPEEYEAYHYEASFTLFGRQQGPHVQAGLQALTDALVAGTPAPAGLPELPSTAIVIPDLPLLPEPDPTRVLAQPAATPRMGQSRFVWQGGDPAVDDPHVVVERQEPGGIWVPVTTDDGFEDLVSFRHPDGLTGNEWTHTWEPDVCAPLGPHRILVRGATAGGPYEVSSAEFPVVASPAPTAGALTVEGDVAWFRATYPEPGDVTPLRLRPRLASGGGGTVNVGDGLQVAARWVAERLRYEAPIPAAATPAASTTAPALDAPTFGDGCGNGVAVYPASVSDPTGGDGRPLPATGGAHAMAALLLVAAGLVTGRTARRRCRRS